MIKKNKGFFIVTCVITILPMIFGILLWNKLPDQVATHFGFDGKADGYSSKFFAVVGVYLFCLAMHVLCAVVTEIDPKAKNISSKIYRLVLCICPLVSVWVGAVIYGNALGYTNLMNMDVLTNVLLGVIFIAVGNYLPKCRQNYTVGIKLPWTLADEGNWDYTHRMAGKLWVVGGVLTVLVGFQHVVSPMALALVIILVMTLIPTVASYLYYKRH